jgi:DNA-binding GntR family transcriptional regulator
VSFERARPAYAVVKDILSGRIEDGTLPEGTVLLEGALAEIFQSSRSPVKQAFAQLEEAGLVRRFDGRGVAVGPATAPLRRVRITAELLGLGGNPAEPSRVRAWQTLYYGVERDLILHSVFGRFRVGELALARHLGVGRTVARDVLTHAQSVGIVNKDDSAHWSLVPLGEDRFSELYELRMLLEPVMLRAAAPHIPLELLDELEQRLGQVAEAPEAAVSELDRLEDDLHVRCLAFGRMPEFAAALQRARCILVAGKHIQAALQLVPKVDLFMGEHLAIVRALRAGDGERAAAALVAHLEASRGKAADRLRRFHTGNGIAPVPYITDLRGAR